ncbi:MAG: hypothetical protein U0X92_04375 [Anaerolineales bacterium]
MKEERDLNYLFLFPPSAAALILRRRILQNSFAARLSILYSPKDPFDWTNESLRTRRAERPAILCKETGARSS